MEVPEIRNVFEHGGKWWFFEVNWKVKHGPFDTYDEANTAFQVYVREVKMCPTGGCED